MDTGVFKQRLEGENCEDTNLQCGNVNCPHTFLKSEKGGTRTSSILNYPIQKCGTFLVQPHFLIRLFEFKISKFSHWLRWLLHTFVVEERLVARGTLRGDITREGIGGLWPHMKLHENL
jgi:hypothetical protein